MTSSKSPRDPRADPLLTAQNAALIMIDFQPVQIGSIASINKRLLVANVVALARTARLFGMSSVLSTVNVATGLNRPTITPITDVLGDRDVIDRTSIHAWEDDEFVAAVKATGRRKPVMVALWIEVCLVFPALDALRAGFEVYVVVDAVGGTSTEAHRAGLQRIIQAGGIPVSWIQFACELPRDWNRTDTAAGFAEIVFAEVGH